MLLTVEGTGWANTEFRSYNFKEEEDDNASLVETDESRERRRGSEIPLTKTEKVELGNTLSKEEEERKKRKGENKISFKRWCSAH